MQEIVAKIEMINARRGGDTTEVFKPSILRNEASQITDEDMREIGDWLLALNEKPRGQSILANLCRKLRRRRLIYYGLMDAPATMVADNKRVFPFHLRIVIETFTLAGNMATADWVATQVTDVKDLATRRLRGGLWRSLKTSNHVRPGWARMAEAVFWTQTSKFAAVHTVLRDEVMADVEPAKDLPTSAGMVHQLTLDVGEDSRKLVYYGSAAAIIGSARPSVLWMEVQDGLTTEQEQTLRSDSSRSAIIIGSAAAVAKASESVRKMPMRETQKTAVIYVFTDDEVMGDRLSGQENKVVLVLIIAAHGPIRAHKAHVVMRNLAWRPSILAHFLNIVNLHPFKDVPADSYLQVLYWPLPSRQTSFVGRRAATVMGTLPKVAVSFVTAEEVSEPVELRQEVQSTLNGCLSRRCEEQVMYEMQMLRGGNCLDKAVLSYRTNDEKKEEKELRKLARKEVQALKKAQKAQNLAGTLESQIGAQMAGGGAPQPQQRAAEQPPPVAPDAPPARPPPPEPRMEQPAAKRQKTSAWAATRKKEDELRRQAAILEAMVVRQPKPSAQASSSNAAAAHSPAHPPAHPPAKRVSPSPLAAAATGSMSQLCYTTQPRQPKLGASPRPKPKPSPSAPQPIQLNLDPDELDLPNLP